MDGLALRELERDLERFFEDYNDIWLRGWVPVEECACYPAVDIIDAKDRYQFLVELPGLTEKDFSVEVENRTLTISGKRAKPELKDKDWIHQEILSGEFSREFRLPSDADTEQISAKYTNGILELSIPKKEEAKPKAVKIEVH